MPRKLSVLKQEQLAAFVTKDVSDAVAFVKCLNSYVPPDTVKNKENDEIEFQAGDILIVFAKDVNMVKQWYVCRKAGLSLDLSRMLKLKKDAPDDYENLKALQKIASKPVKKPIADISTPRKNSQPESPKPKSVTDIDTPRKSSSPESPKPKSPSTPTHQKSLSGVITMELALADGDYPQVSLDVSPAVPLVNIFDENETGTVAAKFVQELPNEWKEKLVDLIKKRDLEELKKKQNFVVNKSKITSLQMQQDDDKSKNEYQQELEKRKSRSSKNTQMAAKLVQQSLKDEDTPPSSPPTTPTTPITDSPKLSSSFSEKRGLFGKK